MMNGHEKSDSAIVAVKPANNAEQSAAESAEPRAEAKGNVGQQSARRAQNRESVTQALERLRHAAKQRKKEKFTTPFHHLTIEQLEAAFDDLKQDAAAGVDGVTWKQYLIKLVEPSMNDWMLVDIIHGGHDGDPLALVWTQHGCGAGWSARELGEEAFDQDQPGAALGSDGKFEAACRLLGSSPWRCTRNDCRGST